MRRIRKSPLPSTWLIGLLIVIVLLLGLGPLLLPEYKIWIIMAGLVLLSTGSAGELRLIGPWQLQRLKDAAHVLTDLT